jgi:hypothetical protein
LTRVLNHGLENQKDVRTIAEELVKEAHAVSDEDVDRNKAMAKWGGDWLVERVGDESQLNVMTVCNTGSLATSVSAGIPIDRVSHGCRGMGQHLDSSLTCMNLEGWAKLTIPRQRRITRVRGWFPSVIDFGNAPYLFV